MAGDDNENYCFVEDTDTLAAVVALMRHDNGTAWPIGCPEKHPVFLKMESSLSNLFKQRTLKIEMNRSGRKAMGIVVDAEQKEELSAWASVRAFASSADPVFLDIPDTMPEDGLVLVNTCGHSLGLWIMPDNKSPGMLEDFLSQLVPVDARGLWALAVAGVKKARKNGAKCAHPHLAKAELHTWLAWQESPGERIGAAIAKKYLDPSHDTATRFVNWFKRLYKL